MATFGGETLNSIIKTQRLGGDAPAGTETLYTCPAGSYAEVEFTFIQNGNTNSQPYTISVNGIPILNIAIGGAISALENSEKLKFSLSSGDVLSGTISSSPRFTKHHAIIRQFTSP